MGDPKGFLTTPRRGARRAVRSTCASRTGTRSTRSSPTTELERAGRALHGLRHPVLPPGLPARQPHPRVERPRLPRRLARGDRAAARHEQLPGVHRDAVPGAVRGRVRAGDQQRRGDDQAGRAGDRSTAPGTRAGSPRSRRPTKTGKKVAVVGSGPAGLAAAQQLTRVGHDVMVFERADRIGGLLRYGIPEFKMEKSRLDRRLAQMEAEGTEFRPGVNVGADVTVEQLQREFDAVVLAGGATAARDLPVPGRELDGIHQAMEYLPWANRVQQGDLDDAADHRRGQARGDHRRRRHRRRLPGHRAPAGRRVGDPAGDHADARRRSGPRPCRGRPTRWSTGWPRRTRRAASGSTR